MRYAVIVTLALALSGCYRPKIADGAFRCGPGGLCPDGYVCNALMYCAAPREDVDMGDGTPLFGGGLGPLDLTGQSGILLCSTKTGEIRSMTAAGQSADIIPPMSDGFTMVPQSGGPAVAIWSFTRLSIPAGVSLKPMMDSEEIPVFASAGDITMDGTIDWRGFGGAGGVAGMPGSDGMSGAGSGGTAGMGDGGGGGGGHAQMGGMGMGTGGGAGGQPVGTPDLMPVYVGSGGGGGGNTGGSGGKGGGSVVLIAASSLDITGRIDVSGSIGSPANAIGGGGGGGGGSGGSILVSGMNVNLNPGHGLLARGGAGGQGMGTGAAGGDGSDGRIWIGGALSASGGIIADPMPPPSGDPITAFPQ